MNKNLVLILLVFLSGCTLRTQKKSNIKLIPQLNDELIARVSFIPDTPFFARVEEFSEDPKLMYNIIVRYRFFEDVTVVKNFYLEEMERSGWKIMINVDAVDQVMVFEKPKLVCVIEIRPKESGYTVTLGRKIFS